MNSRIDRVINGIQDWCLEGGMDKYVNGNLGMEGIVFYWLRVEIHFQTNT